MKEMNVRYLNHLAMNAHFLEIESYPINWKNTLEILFVLDGYIDVTIDHEVYRIEENELEIINPGEVNSISSDVKNRVLWIQIDPDFFANFYKDAHETFYYIDEDDSNKDSLKYQKLKKYLSALVYEIAMRLEGYEEILEKTLLDLMFHLLNHFHYLYYEQEELKEDRGELARFHRIIKYLGKNYKEKVSLQEIAEMEFLTSSYLSHKIKETIGVTFNDYLNQIRVEESTKLLLGSDKSVSEIAFEVGFSHPRYYNKHFQIHYHMTPQEYRDNYCPIEMDESMGQKVKQHPLKEAIPHLERWLSAYERFHYDNEIRKISVDLEGEPVGYFHPADTINLGDVTVYLEDQNMRLLKEAQREIGFKTGLIHQLFSQDLDIYRGKGRRFINWTRVESILDFILRVRLKPLISTKGIDDHILNDFCEHFSWVYDRDVSEWFMPKDFSYDAVITSDMISPSFDTTACIPSILHRFLTLKKGVTPLLMDEITRETELHNDTFFGGGGLFTSNELNKPLFYIYKFMSMLGDEILHREDGVFVTKNEDGYQILLYNSSKEKPSDQRVSINMINMDQKLRITRFELNRQYGSIYDKWEELGSPERIDLIHWNILNEYVQPRVDFYYQEKAVVFNIATTVKKNGMVLYLLNYVPN